MRKLADIIGADLLAFMLALKPDDIEVTMPSESRAAALEAIWKLVKEHCDTVDGSYSQLSWHRMSEGLRVDLFATNDEAIGSTCSPRATITPTLSVHVPVLKHPAMLFAPRAGWRC